MKLAATGQTGEDETCGKADMKLAASIDIFAIMVYLLLKKVKNM